MNLQHDQRYDSNQVIQAALESLRETVGLTGRLLDVKEMQGPNGPDGAVEVQAESRSYRYLVEQKAVADRKALLVQVKSQLEQWERPGLLVVPHMTAAMAEHCRRLNLQFLDAAGNAYLSAPGLYVYVSGQKSLLKSVQHRQGQALGTPTAMRMIFALLCHPELVRAPYRDIVEAAGIALGAVGKIFDQLQRRGFVSGADKTHGRKLLEAGRLLDEWVAMYPAALRPKLRSRRFLVPDLDALSEYQPPAELAWWGGEVAAERLTGHLRPASSTLYVAPGAVSEISKQLISKYRLRPDPEGPVELLDAFWRFPTTAPRPDVVPPQLAYADLVASLESRNLEAARIVREEFVGDAYRQA